MKLLLDEGLPHPAADALRRLGFDAVHTSHIKLQTADDLRIIEAARDAGRVVVTLDSDFHAIVALSGAAKPSVIRIRVEGLRWQELAELIARVIGEHREAIESGALVSVRERDVRLRRLPMR